MCIRDRPTTMTLYDWFTPCAEWIQVCWDYWTTPNQIPLYEISVSTMDLDEVVIQEEELYPVSTSPVIDYAYMNRRALPTTAL